MAVLASTVVRKILNQFLYKDAALPLSGSITNSQTTLQVNAFLPNIGPGSVLQIENEYLLATGYTGTTTLTVTVVRGWLGSTAASHNSGVPVYVNPRILGDEALDYINECLDQLYPTLYQVDIDTLTYSGSLIGYGLSVDVGFPIRVDFEDNSQALYWKRLGDFTYIPQADTASFPNGKAIMIRGSMPHGAKVRVMYAKPFIRVTSPSADLIATAGLEEYMTDLPYYYAMWRIMASQEVSRSDSAGAASHQRAQDVPVFTALRTADWYKARYNDLLMNSKARLRMEVSDSPGIGGFGN